MSVATRAKPKSDSAAERRLALRMRSDLDATLQDADADRVWVVRDPVTLSYFHLREEEYAVLTMLDGQASAADIKRRFEERFAPLQLPMHQIQSFLGRLYDSGLIVSDAPGQGDELFERRRRRRRGKWLQQLGNVLSIRLGSLDPEPVLAWLAPRLAWLFSWWFLALCTALVIAAATLAAVEFQTLRARLPDFHTFFAAKNVALLAVAMALVKCVHELGHALACKRFGGECHEIGLLLLIFTPCLYCNVSDAWRFPSRWARIAVSAAGVVVELVLAALCMFLWWLSGPGLINSLLLNLVVVCSVSTLAFNGNPLLRYDGYYVLSDLIGLPNLAQQSRAVLLRWLGQVALGLRPTPDRSLPRRRRFWIGLYGAASAAYRWVVVFGVLWVCHKAAKPYRLEVLVDIAAIASVGGMVAMPLWSLGRFLANPMNRRGIRRGRAAWSVLAAILLIGGVLLIPLPHRIAAPLVLQAEGGRYVYVTVAGRLVESLPAGAKVEAGRPVGRLENLALEKERIELEAQVRQQRRFLQNLRARLNDDPALGPQIPPAAETLDDLEKRLQQRLEDQQRLVLCAPAAGTVIPPPIQADRYYRPEALPTWQRTPLEEEARGTSLDVGTLFCIVGDPERLEALLVIEQDDVALVRVGQTVRLTLDQTPGEVITGEVVELAKTDLKVAPRELTKALPVRMDPRGVPRPATISYQARVRLDPHDRVLLVGAPGRAKILAEPMPLGQRLYRFAVGLFEFRL